ncbi:MAG: hypothetical protein F4X99_07005 [Gammaproteobacteria bacterium]|nr:hypothetical protein [Gammaproteobacteria bacterium]
MDRAAHHCKTATRRGRRGRAPSASRPGARPFASMPGRSARRPGDQRLPDAPGGPGPRGD